MTGAAKRDHGGGVDAAVARFGGVRGDWIDLSTGINPRPYPIGDIPAEAWTRLPDSGAFLRLEQTAREFWNVPDRAAVVAASGVSAIIAQMPAVLARAVVSIARPTYNEHEASFRTAGFDVSDHGAIKVVVHPNNPDGRLVSVDEVLQNHREVTIIDESFCDCSPDASVMELADRKGIVILKGLGKFWGLAGLRLGFAIGDPVILARLSDKLGPWAVSGPALAVGARALGDNRWATETRARLDRDAARLDALCGAGGLGPVGGTSLFRLYSCSNSDAVFGKLAEARILTRIFPYSDHWIRLGLPDTEDQWQRLSDVFGV